VSRQSLQSIAGYLAVVWDQSEPAQEHLMLMMIYWLHTLETAESSKAQGPWFVCFASCVEAAWFGMMLLSCLPGKMVSLDQQGLKCAGKQNL